MPYSTRDGAAPTAGPEIASHTTGDPKLDMAFAGMRAWDAAMKAKGPKTWVDVLGKVYAAMKAVDPTARRALADATGSDPAGGAP